MKISKKIEPIILGIFGSIIISVLSFLSFETSTGFWLIFSFGSSTLIVLVFHKSEFAQPANVFFGHLLAIVIGILFNRYLFNTIDKIIMDTDPAITGNKM